MGVSTFWRFFASHKSFEIWPCFKLTNFGIWPGFKLTNFQGICTQPKISPFFCGPWKIQSWKVKISQFGMGYVTLREGTVLGAWPSVALTFWCSFGAKAPFLRGVKFGEVGERIRRFAQDLQANFRQLSIWFYLFNGFFPVLFSKTEDVAFCVSIIFISHPIHKFLPRSLFDKLLEFAASLWGSDFGCFAANVWASWLHLERSTRCATAGHSCHTAKEWKAWGGCQQMSLKIRRSVVALEVINLSSVKRIKQDKRMVIIRDTGYPLWCIVWFGNIKWHLRGA